MLAALAVGPWPALGSWTLLLRAPLAIALLALAWPRLGWRRLALAALLAAGFAIDGLFPAVRPAGAVAAGASTAAERVQAALGRFGERIEVRRLLAGPGGEANPNEPFVLIASLEATLPFVPDALLLADERGQPIAWRGALARPPGTLRLPGDRAVVVEPGVRGVWVWWREPVLEAGRALGSVLLGERLDSDGETALLGESAGRVAKVLPGDGATLALPGGRSVTIAVTTAPARPWSAPGLVVLATIALMVPVTAGAGRLALLAVALPVASLQPSIGLALPAAVALALLAVALPLVPRAGRVLAPALALAFGVVVPAALVAWRAEPVPDNLLWPGLARWALLAGTALLFRSAAVVGRLQLPWWLAPLAWLPVVAGVAVAEPWLLALGAVTFVLAGLPGSGVALPALLAASLLAGAADSAARNSLIASSRATLAAISERAGRSAELLGEVGADAIAELSGSRPDVLAIVGRIALSTELGRRLPGATLVARDPAGQVAAVWGEALTVASGGGHVLARRELSSGWSLSLLEPPPPHDLLAALAATHPGTPVAVYDRSGSPTGRGAIFRPLPLAAVADVLPAGEAWRTLGVWEREFPTLLLGRGDAVVAVPWVRRSLPETGLVVAGMALWAALPVLVIGQHRRVREWWAGRNTFAARVQALTVASALVPVLVLVQLVPEQWHRQRERSRLELARSLIRPISLARLDEDLPWFVRETGAVVAVYRSGTLVSTTRPDLVALGGAPAMPPETAFVRAVRGWREPVVVGGARVDVFAPLLIDEDPVVVAVLGMSAGLAPGATPREWFLVTAALAIALALVAGERLGRRLAEPLGRLVAAARRVEAGQPVEPLDVGVDEDVAALSRAFGAMAERVQQREDELRAERDLLERVLGTLSAAVVVLDGAGRVDLANPAATGLLGPRVEDALEDRFGASVAPLFDRARSGQPAVATVQPAGVADQVWRLTLQPLVTPGSRLLVVLEDLSDVARAERLASLSEAARIVAHEVKNPLTPIRLWAEELSAALERGPAATADVARVAAEQILERVAHLREVVQGFTNLVGIERWHEARVRPLELARQVVAEYGVLRQRGISTEVRGAASAEVIADADWLTRALRHLLENSVRALAGRDGRISVEVKSAGETVEIAVSDTGGGVPEEHLPRLFEPHFSTTSEGSGLGLAVVRRVAVRAGGRTEARNEAGGLAVRLILPAAPALLC